MDLESNALYYGDCLEWLPRFPSESVDLIYLDPPFNSNTSYNLLFGNGQPKRGGKGAQVRAFDDTWRWDDAAARRVDRLSDSGRNLARLGGIARDRAGLRSFARFRALGMVAGGLPRPYVAERRQVNPRLGGMEE